MTGVEVADVVAFLARDLDHLDAATFDEYRANAQSIVALARRGNTLAAIMVATVEAWQADRRPL